MEKKQLGINLISNSIAFISSLIISFILTPYLIESIGKEAYSFFPISNNFVNYLTIVTLALNSMAARFITVELHKKNIKRANKYYSSVFFSNLILIAILFFPMGILIYNLEKILNIPFGLVKEIKILFLFVFASMLINLFSTTFSTATYVKDRMDLKGYFEISRGILRLILYYILFKMFEPTIVFVGLVAFLLSLYNLLIQVIISKKILSNFKISYRKYDMKLIKELLTAGTWNTINSLGSTLLLGFSLLMANYFIGTSAAGDLSIVLMLPQFISGIITMVCSVFLPRLTKSFALHKNKMFLSEILFSQKILSLLTTIPVALVMIFGEEFFRLWIPTEYMPYIPKLSLILLIPLLIHGNMWSIYGVNIVMNKVKIPSLILLVLGFLNIILCVILLPIFKYNIFVIPVVSSIINTFYYLVIIPLYTSYNLGISSYIIYKNMIVSCLFTIFFIVASKKLKLIFPTINSWVEFFLVGGFFGIVGLLINIVIVQDKKELLEFLETVKKRFQKP